MTKTEWVISILVVLALIGVLSLAVVEGHQWDKFKVTHQCRKVAHISGDIHNVMTVDTRGNPAIGIAATPDKEGWLCNDGITYYR